jgi:predicted permease
VGIVENVPLNEGVRGGQFVTEDRAAEPDAGALVYYTFSGEDYFEAMGIEVVQGRTFEAADHLRNPGHALVSRSAAQLLWPGEDPIGRRVRPRDREEERWETVIGVVGDVLQNDLREQPLPMIYLPLAGTTPDAYRITTPGYVVKSRRAAQIAPEVRALVREVAPLAPVYRVYTMERLVADSMARLSFTMLTLGVASALALLLGAIGLFGVLSYVVSQRTREIGLRMALGAQAGRVQGMVVRQGLWIVLGGVALGVAVALGSTRALDRLLFGVEPVDPSTFLVMSVAMLAIGALASYLPARRASSVDPMESLRSD